MVAGAFDRQSASAGLGVLAVGLLLPGAAKIGSHLSWLAALDGTLCGSGAPLSRAGMMLDGAAHCWGCPAVVAGSLLGVAALMVMKAGPDTRPTRPATALPLHVTA